MSLPKCYIIFKLKFTFLFLSSFRFLSWGDVSLFSNFILFHFELKHHQIKASRIVKYYYIYKIYFNLLRKQYNYMALAADQELITQMTALFCSKSNDYHINWRLPLILHLWVTLISNYIFVSRLSVATTGYSNGLWRFSLVFMF